jgi:myo-inositol-1(or 4)-monophosphatase
MTESIAKKIYQENPPALPKELLKQELQSLGAASLKMREGTLMQRSKSAPLDIVTEADLFVEARLREFIQKHRPEDGFAGEEGNRIETKNDLVWYNDPIDGTLNYSRGDANYSISVACAKEDRPLLAAVYFPVSDLFFEATAGCGASVNNIPFKAPLISKSNKEICGEFCMSRKDSRLKDCYQILSTNVGYLFSYACATHSAVQVAQGKMDFFVHNCPTVYDYAAVALIAQEAGCYVAQDFQGSAIKIKNGPTPLVVCRTKEIASQLGELLRIERL